MNRSEQFPWRAQNQFELFVDAEEFYPAMLAAIDMASHYILLEQYIIESGSVFDKFRHHLINASKRGVKIFILADDFGSQGLSYTDRQHLIDHAISLAFFNPTTWSSIYLSMKRNHRKLLVVDNKIAFVGGANISDDYETRHKKHGAWHDVMVSIKGEVIGDWTDSFCFLWRETNGDLPTIPELKITGTGDQTGRVCIAYGLTRNEITRSALAHIRKSERRIWIATPYFVTTRRLRHELKRAAKRGIDVRLLLPGPISDHRWISQAARRYYRRMLRNGIKIFEYQPRFIHAKLILCDDWVSAGSSNLDRWNQRWNYDANQTILHTEFSEQVAKLFETDFKQSKQIILQDWDERPVLQRFREWLSGHYVSFLQWFSYYISRSNKKSGR
jgi:cardiolipin synthase